MTSQVDICNIALARMGNGQQISSLDEGSQEAVTLNLLYEPALRKVLRDVDWPFARKRASMQLIEEEPNSDWAYSYRYPTDCIMFRRIVTGKRPRLNVDPIPYEIANGDTSRVIYTDQEEATGVYTVFVNNVTYYDDAFVSMLAWRLCMEAAMPLAVERNRRTDAMQMYNIEKGEAMAGAFNEGQVDKEADSEYIRARD